ncbi:MAG: transcriptional repressor [Clostridiales bacterium]|jgi:Fe2+ or Zn2+ uptake regulation protein|nr:transcriptional repressor [Clostridiales bacterium]
MDDKTVTLRRMTKQKEAVKKALAELGHPTAEELYASIKNAYPMLSRATVYRNLGLLANDGVVDRVIGMPDGGERFDATTSPHYHFICLKCGAVSDIDIAYKSDEDRQIEERYGYRVTGHKANFFGYCDKCAGADADI